MTVPDFSVGGQSVGGDTTTFSQGEETNDKEAGHGEKEKRGVRGEELHEKVGEFILHEVGCSYCSGRR